jgi:predicted transcriptional regulator
MTSIELKKVLIHRISEINDILFLKAIKTILDLKTESEMITLSPEQRNEIIESKKEIEQGLFIEHELINKKVSTWLNAK